MPVFDVSPIDSDNTEFMAGSESISGIIELPNDIATPGAAPPSGVNGTLTIFQNTDAESTNKLSGSAFLHGLEYDFQSTGGAPPQRLRYRFHMTGAITDTNP